MSEEGFAIILLSWLLRRRRSFFSFFDLRFRLRLRRRSFPFFLCLLPFLWLELLLLLLLLLELLLLFPAFFRLFFDGDASNTGTARVVSAGIMWDTGDLLSAAA